MEDDDDDELDLFIDAQDTVWDQVVAELKAGEKDGHWMWFVFPQLAELGKSDMAKLYGIHDLSEATDYLAHATLGPRLVEVSELVLLQDARSAEGIFGSLDASKLRSSMTLFSAVPGANPVFQNVLDRFFTSSPCPITVEALSR